MWATCVELKLATCPIENLSLNESKIGRDFVINFLNFFELVCFIWFFAFRLGGIKFNKDFSGAFR